MAKEKKEKKEKKPSDLNEKELNDEIDKILEKSFKDYKSQEELDSFIEKTFNEKTEKYNKELKNKEKLDCDDLHALAYLPVMCDKEERNYYRMEYFKIINQLQY